MPFPISISFPFFGAISHRTALIEALLCKPEDESNLKWRRSAYVVRCRQLDSIFNPIVDFLKLGLFGLPQAEVRLIATLFRLHSIEPSFIWTLPAQAPFDAILVDASVPESDMAPLRINGARIMRLSAPGQKLEGEMPRPIRSDRLIAWLNSIEVGLLHGERDGAASTASHSTVAAALDRQTPSGATKPPSAPMNADQATQLDLSDQELTFKLKRWPPSYVVEKDVNRIRLATVLSRKPISLKELTALARIGEHECKTFIQTVATLGLLLVERRVEKSPEQDLLTEFPMKVEPSKPVAKRGGFALISSIRRRFGLI